MKLTAEDKIEIQELTAAYALAMDQANVSAWLATWTDDGAWEGGLGTYTGKTQLRNLLSDLGDRIKGKRHVMTNSVIQGNNDGANQTCYLLVVEAQGEPRILATALYQDKLANVDGAWKFLHRKVTLDRVPTAPQR